ncbi:MAG: glycosyltransferase family 2 protein [Anaerolineaceae bacterium]|nr:glycosyltransferase family 2 protein [Anaerolineaceae bacterium]
MKKGLLSIVIPVYNSAQFLENCLSSVILQTYSNIEIICVDDASTDESAAILFRYAKKDPRIRIIQHDKNQGRLEARRTGVEQSNGEFIQFVDSDDTIDSELCECAVREICANDADILQFSSVVYFVNTDKKDIFDPVCERFTGQEILQNLFFSMKIPFSLWKKIYRSEICRLAFKEIPCICGNIGEDILLSFFIAYYGESFVGVKTKAKYNYYHGRGITSDGTMPLATFRRYCEMNQFCDIVSDFQRRLSTVEPSLEVVSKQMTFRLISECCSAYSRVSPEDLGEAAEIFWKSWSGKQYFAEGMMFAVSEQSKVIEEIRNSESYKLGNSIIAPFRFVKSKLL